MSSDEKMAERKLSLEEKNQILSKTLKEMITKILEKRNVTLPQSVLEEIINIALLISQIEEITVTVP